MSHDNRDKKEEELDASNYNDESLSDVEVDLENDLIPITNIDEIYNLLDTVSSGTEEEICDALIFEPLLDIFRFGGNSVQVLTPPENVRNQHEENSGPIECRHVDISNNFQEDTVDARNKIPQEEISSTDNNISPENASYKDLPNDAMARMKQGVKFFHEWSRMVAEPSDSMERTTTVLPAGYESDSLNDKDVPSTSHSQSYNIAAPCSHDRDPKHVPVPSKYKESKLNLKMPTICKSSEEFGFNRKIISKDASRPNPSKIQANIGIHSKCTVCKKRLGLCAIQCRCGNYYCAKHRYDWEHKCTFNYRSMGREEIRRNNPRVIAEKVRKL